MKVTGNKMQQAAKRLRLSVDVTRKQFEDNVFQFATSEEKPDLEDLGQRLQTQEVRLARLNHFQSLYNHKVEVAVDGNTITLDEAIKMVGPAGRLEKQWRQTVTGDKKERYGYRDTTERDPTREYAKRTISIDAALKKSDEVGRWAANLREAIQTGNTTPVEFTDFEPSLLDG